jgi:uncharacterized protein YdeI (BOF family)
MKKIRITLLAASAFLGLFSTCSQAAPHRPYHFTTVRWVVATRDNLDVDDNYVTLIGHVTRRIGDEEYWFTDGTGSVRLDSEDFDLPIGARIIVGGRIDQAYLGFGHLEVDVRHWRYVPVNRPVKTTFARTTAAPAPAPAPAVAAPSAAASATAPAPTATSASLTPPSEPAATNAPGK